MSRTLLLRERRGVRLFGACLAACLAFSLAACAPEDTEVAPTIPQDAAGAPGADGKTSETGKTGETSNTETEWGGQGVDDYVPTTELPESFPTDRFTLPDDAHVLDAGERAVGQWFVVLHVESGEAADALWASLIEANSMTVSDEIETSEGGWAATLQSASLSVQALTIPQSDGSVQLNYDIARVA